MKKFVFLFPGQGSQYVGMGEDFYNNYSIVRNLFDQASDELDMNLKKLCFEGPETILVQTDNVQPAVTLINIACYEVLKEQGIFPVAAAGHSLGEYTALYSAGVLDFLQVMKLVKYRGDFMKEAAEKNKGGMIAIMAFDRNKINSICKDVQQTAYAEIANYNSPKQTIVTGEDIGLEKVTELAKKEGAKFIIPLKVSGPWHSKFMREAKENMETIVLESEFKKSSIPVIANTTASYESQPEQIKTNIINQITSPVLWWDSINRFIEDGYTNYIEAGPNKVLKGTLKEINRDLKVYNVGNMKDLEGFLASMNDI